MLKPKLQIGIYKNGNITIFLMWIRIDLPWNFNNAIFSFIGFCWLEDWFLGQFYKENWLIYRYPIVSGSSSHRYHSPPPPAGDSSSHRCHSPPPVPHHYSSPAPRGGNNSSSFQESKIKILDICNRIQMKIFPLIFIIMSISISN